MGSYKIESKAEHRMKSRNQSRLRRALLLYVAPPVLLVIAIVLVVFLYIQFHQPVELDVTSQGFGRNTVEITEGETIHFVNRSGVVQVLCCASLPAHPSASLSSYTAPITSRS
jgi:hypothetical protein